MSNTEIQPWIANRILAFFNRAHTVDDVVNGTIQDDPSDGPRSTRPNGWVLSTFLHPIFLNH